MADSLISNALQVNFDSVLSFPDEGMVAIFKALESNGLRGFLGCPSVLYEKDLESFFSNATVHGDPVISCVQSKYVGISEELFAASGDPVKTSCKNKKLKIEFRLMNDILAKYVTVKARSFDAVTHERFLLMTAIHFGLKINWSKILFDILKEMVTKSFKQAKGFAAQICVLSKGAPDLNLGEAKTFPPLKILTVKTVGTYVSKNKNIAPEDETDEPTVEKILKKAAAKRRPAPAVAEPAAKNKRTTVGRAAPTEKNLALVPVVQDVVQAASPSARELRASKRKLKLQESDVEEIVAKGTDRWRSGCRLYLFRKREQLPQIPALDAFVPMCFFIEPVQDLDSRQPYSGIVRRRWAEVCVDIVQFYLFGHLQPVDFTESFSQLRASIDKITLEHVRTQDDVADLKASLCSKITNLEAAFAHSSTNQGHILRNLIHDVQQELKTQQAALSQDLNLVELYMREVVAEHWKEFHKEKPSANQDLMEIRLLEAELAQTSKSINLFQARADLPVTYNERYADRVASSDITL
ncbi:TMV resistance protein N-like [Dorcoceras hygrometricum]|uniref:TMV resistance protein N-like n=1 Tax=Dorcoceras hygrometricum TaxID=472368 RepID=A0A2Z7D7Q0_9LAMI|nr:TMV resistance protein N-like [Dorcoceras hygrometricum]